MLLEAGGDVNKGDNNGCTPVLAAFQQGHLSTVRALLAAGADAESIVKEEYKFGYTVTLPRELIFG